MLSIMIAHIRNSVFNINKSNKSMMNLELKSVLKCILK